MNQKIRLLAIIPSSVCFGLQNITFSLFSRFSPAIAPHFLVTTSSDGEFARRLDALHIPHTSTFWQMFPLSKLSDLKTLFKTLFRLPRFYYDYFRLLHRFNPDVLFFANHHELILLFPVLLFRRIPVVCHMHDPFPPTRVQRLSFKLYGFNVDRFVTISQSVTRRLIELGCPPGKITTIYNGVPVPELQRTQRSDLFIKQLNLRPDAVIAGMTGQLTPTKGHSDLLEAARLLKEKCPNLHFVIGGKQDNAYQRELKAYVEKNGLADSVHFVGWQPDVNALFQAIDVFVLLTRHDEGFGLVVAEAMVNCIPVVATKSGGVTEIVSEGNTGFLVDKNAPEQLAEKLAYLYAHPEVRAQMGAAGRERIAEHFEIERQTGEFERFLRDIAE